METLSVFAKYWEPGHVKTRLARSVGDTAAARLHEAFLRTTLARADGLADRQTVVFTPSDRRCELERLAGERWHLEPQTSGNLGQRMEAHAKNLWNQGAEKIVLLGADSPHFSPERVSQAFDRLDAVDAVLGPTEDGGYYLLGLRRLRQQRSLPIFSGIPWGTDAVLRETLRQLETAGLRHEALPVSYDIDEIEDLERLRSELDEPMSRDPLLESPPLLESLRREIRQIMNEEAR